MISNYVYPAPEPGLQERARELFSFEGRIGRQSYWLRGLLLWGITIAAFVLFALAGEAGAAGLPIVLLGVAIYLAALVGSLATTIKRLHDRGRSGWFMLIGLIPLVGLWVVIEVGFLAGEREQNEYGTPVA